MYLVGEVENLRDGIFFFGLVEKKKKNEKIENRVCINLPIYLDTQFFFLKARINYSFLIIKNTHVQVKKKVIHLTQKKKKKKKNHPTLFLNKKQTQKSEDSEQNNHFQIGFAQGISFPPSFILFILPKIIQPNIPLNLLAFR